jgi:hypothetical protein
MDIRLWSYATTPGSPPARDLRPTAPADPVRSVDSTQPERTTMRRIGTAATLALGLLLALGGPAAAAPPLQISGGGDVFDCGDTSYTVTAGSLFVRHEVHTTPSGTSHAQFHLVGHRLEAVDQSGDSFRIVGSATNVVHYDEDASITGEQLTIRMRILSQHGSTAGVAHLSLHVARDGDVRFTQAGTCTAPDTI